MKRTVVDTSVWRAFFSGRKSASRLGDLLEESGVVLVHPLVIGELVLGGLALGEERLLQRLPQAEPTGYVSVLAAIRRYKLARRGVGWVDAELVSSALQCKALLWSLDRSLSSVADELGLGFGPMVISS
ncbi:MAG TPA: PIN domain-containing protein [Polyangiaceae bacterium]